MLFKSRYILAQEVIETIEFILEQVFARIPGLVIIVIVISPFVYWAKKFQKIKGLKYKRGTVGFVSYLLDILLDSGGLGFLVGPWCILLVIGILMLINV